MMMLQNYVYPIPEGVDRYLALWPGWSIHKRTGRYVWRNFNPLLFDFVAVKLSCDSCGTPIGQFGISLRPDSDHRAVLWAALHGAEVSFNVGRGEAGPDGPDLQTIRFRCARKFKGVRCTGDNQRNIALLVQVLDMLLEEGEGQHAVIRARTEKLPRVQLRTDTDS